MDQNFNTIKLSENNDDDDLLDKLNVAYITINALNIELTHYSELLSKIEREQSENIQYIVKMKEELINLKEQNKLLNKVINDKNNLVNLNNNLIIENENLININKNLINNIEELNKEVKILKEYNYIDE